MAVVRTSSERRWPVNQYTLERFIFLAFLALIIWCFGHGCQAQGLPLVKVSHESFTSYYDTQTNCPAMVVYDLWPEHFAGNVKVSGRHFKSDTKLPRPRVKDSDYSGTGYVRGHLCSAADRDSKKSWLKETYLTSNLVPMTMVCNAGRWKVIEDSCRLIARSGHPLRVVRLPLYEISGAKQLVCYDDGTNARDNVVRVRIPSAFLCLAACINHGETFQFLAINSTAAARSTFVGSNANVYASGECTTRTMENYFVAAEVPKVRVVQEPGMCNPRSAAEQIHMWYKDIRIVSLLHNILGLWSREVYETITH